MSNLAKVVVQLRQQRQEAQKKVEQLDRALAALGGVSKSRGTGRGQKSSTKRRTMSAAARKKIAVAQRARWAKWKAAQKA